ncbi:restriction endonuclease subunit S [Roseateles sp. P5_D6]
MSESFRHATVESLAGPWKGSIKIGPFGSQLKREDMVEHGQKVYGQENVIANDWLAGDRRVSSAKFNALRSCELHPGDVVLSMMGTVGKCAVFPPSAEPGLMDSHLLRIQPNPELVTREFLTTVLQAENVVGRQVSSMSHGSIMAGLSSSIVRRFVVPLPPLNEQPMLSAILDTLDSTIRQTEAIVEKLKQVKQGLLHDLLTRGIGANGELRPPQSQAPRLYKESQLGWIPKSWNDSDLESLVAAPICYGVVQVFSFVPDGVPVLAIKDLLGDYVTGIHRTARSIDAAYSRSRVKPGDVLVSIKGTIGRIGVVPDHYVGNISRDMARLRPGPMIRADYFGQLLQSPMGQQILGLAQVGTTRAELSIAPLKKLRFALPEPNEQALIERVLSDHDQQLRTEGSTLSKLRTLKSGLLDDLLTGRVRVTPLLTPASP